MKVKSFSKQQSGFTLIELVVVIVILGILAATAIPRFINMGTQARQGAQAGMLGAVQSASALAHAQALVTNQTGASGNVAMDGVAAGVPVAFGYPTAASIATALAAQDGFTFTSTATVGTFTLTAGTNCTVTYTPPVAANGAPAIAASGNCS